MLKNLRRSLSDFDRDDLLEHVGLQSRPSTGEKLVPALALFGAGVLVGVGLGLMLAPKSGTELRGELQSRFKRGDGLVRDGEKAPTSAPIRSA